MRALLLCILLLLSACAGSRTAHQVEICLSGEAQAREFTDFMKSVAHRSGLEFIDGAARYDETTVLLGVPTAGRSEGDTIYFGAESLTGGGGFTAANMSLNNYQIAVGMTPTRDASFDLQVIEGTTTEIIRRWPARRVPSSDTFHPRAGCGDGSG